MRRLQGSKIIEKIVLPTIAVDFIGAGLMIIPETKSAIAATGSVTIAAEDVAGTVLPEMYVALLNQDSAGTVTLATSGFTPVTISVTDAKQFVQVTSSFQDLQFAYWKDDSTNQHQHKKDP